MDAIGNALGEICKAVLPIPQESYRGNPESRVAVCTLSDIRLLESLAKPDVLGRVNIVGRLLSENRGIDAILRYLYAHKRVRVVVVCGMDARGHRAGHSLFRLHRHGVDRLVSNTASDPTTGKAFQNRISGSLSPDPHLAASPEQIEHFRRNVTLVDMTGTSDRAQLVKSIIGQLQ